MRLLSKKTGMHYLEIPDKCGEDHEGIGGHPLHETWAPPSRQATGWARLWWFPSLVAGFVLALLFFSPAAGEEGPDELYRQGRFAEAEKAYADSDMDHPKDVRFRFNRGCAAYQNSDYQSAMASFSSVLRRTQDDETGFKTAYNMGNTAFKQGDLESAADHYKKALLFNTKAEDARHNLELTLRALEKQKKDKQEESEQQPQKDGEHQEEDGETSKRDQNGKNPEKAQSEPAEEDPSDQEHPQGDDQQEESSEQEQTGKPQESRQAEQESPLDLSGDLSAMNNALPEETEQDQDPGHAPFGIDKKRAEALLNNVQEDRSKYIRLRVPQDKRHGVASGRDW